MPAWPGGECPECGHQVPANVIRCCNCRALLNNDLAVKPIIAPDFVPLSEISPCSDAPLRGFYLPCPACRRDLRINASLFGQHVECRFCRHPFELDRERIPPTAGYAHCAHCGQELRAATKFFDRKVACRHCGGAIRLVDPMSATVSK